MTEGGFIILYIVTFFVIGILSLAPIAIIVGVIIYLHKKSNQQNKEMQEQAMARQLEKERLAQEELNLKKMKYKKVRCKYCDSLNPLDKVECTNCGASLQGVEGAQ